MSHAVEVAGLSLTEARILWLLEHATHMCSRAICEQLRLDAGYVSRLLTRFEAMELVYKRASSTDKRSKDIVLTAKGKKLAEQLNAGMRAEIERRFAGMPDARRRQMLRAMGIVERAFEEPDVSTGVQYRAPRTGDISYAVYRQAVLYHREYGWDQRFESLLHHIADQFITKFKPDREAGWIAEYGGEIVGSLFLIEQAFGVAQLRMLYVEPHVRGMGIGKRLLETSIAFARAKGYCSLRLWTNDVLHRARAMYEKAGFRLLESTPNDEFGENLTAQVWELQL